MRIKLKDLHDKIFGFERSLILFLIIKICMFSSIVFAENEVNPTGIDKTERISESANIPKFKKIKVISDVKNFIPSININEGARIEKAEVLKTEVSKEDQAFNIESGGIKVAKFRLTLTDKKGNINTSENKTVIWSGSDADKADDLINIMGKAISGINVSMERSPTDRDTLIISIKKD